MKFLQFGLFLACALLLPSCSALRETSPLDHLKQCHADEGPTDGYCGTLDVFEDRQAQSGRQISLKIVVLPALKQDSAPDPLFFLAGGPGQGAAQLADKVQDAFHNIESRRDLVFVDQRGTGKSNPLDCKPPKDKEDEEDDDTSEAAKRLRACLDSYKNKADVTKYTTEIAMDDLDDVRKFLGYSTINLYGASYGTRAAIVFVRRHHDHTRAAILDSVAPTDMKLPLFMARDSQRALDLLLRDCTRDPGCNQHFPNLRSRLDALLARLSAHPQHIRYLDPRTGLEKETDIRRLTVTSLIFASLYSPTTAAMIPLLIDEADKGNFSGFLALGAAGSPLSDNISIGMQFSVLCAEDAPQIEPGAVEQETAGTFLGAELAGLRLKPCEFWPRPRIDPAYYLNAPSDIPALILSGEFDPVTPPVWGQEVASQWKNSRHIIVPATGHGTFAAGCVMKLIEQFIDAGSAAKLNASCVDRLKRPAFFLGPSGPDPMSEASK